MRTLQVRIAAVVIGVAFSAMLVVFGATHWLAPRIFTHYDNAPELAAVPKRTTNKRHAAADPVNVALIGSLSELKQAMHDAGWAIADSIDRESDIAIAKSVLFNRPDSTAPVSPLFLFGRAQDIAFEHEVGHSARRRHHVRFWLAPGILHGGRQVWVGDATFDLRAGISHRGFHPTHHIAPDVDQERDTVISNLAHAGQITTLLTVSGMGVRVNDHNAEGDRFDTDGEMMVGILSPANSYAVHTDTLSDPPIVALKERLWRWVHEEQ